MAFPQQYSQPFEYWGHPPKSQMVLVTEDRFDLTKCQTRSHFHRTAKEEEMPIIKVAFWNVPGKLQMQLIGLVKKRQGKKGLGYSPALSPHIAVFFHFNSDTWGMLGAKANQE